MADARYGHRNCFNVPLRLYVCPTTFSDVGMNDAVFEIFDVDYRRLICFLPTDHEDTWPDWRDRNLQRSQRSP